MGGVIFLAVMLLIAWLVVILPQQRRVRAHQALVATLDEGEEVMTTSGILGTITAIDGEILKLEVAPGIELRVVRGAVARRVEPDEVADSSAGHDSTAGADDADPGNAGADGAGAETKAAPATEE